MRPLYFLYRNIAVGQKSSADPGPYGQGFNYQIEAGFTVQNTKALDAVLKRIDHQLLGLDTDVVKDPTTARIARWIFDELKDEGLIELHLIRGDGLRATVRA